MLVLEAPDNIEYWKSALLEKIKKNRVDFIIFEARNLQPFIKGRFLLFFLILYSHCIVEELLRELLVADGTCCVILDSDTSLPVWCHKITAEWHMTIHSISSLQH